LQDPLVDAFGAIGQFFFHDSFYLPEHRSLLAGVPAFLTPESRLGKSFLDLSLEIIRIVGETGTAGFG
jgi:hypothetical protein